MDMHGTLGKPDFEEQYMSSTLDCIMMITALYNILEQNGLTDAEQFDSICNQLKDTTFKSEYDSLNG